MPAGFAKPLPTFEARYTLFDGKKQIGTTRITLSKATNGYVFETQSSGEGGVAGLLGAKINERSEFGYQGEIMQPLRYRYQQKVAFSDRRRDIDFDWSANRIRETEKKKPVDYAATAGTLDRHLVVLALARDLASGAKTFVHPVAYKGEVSPWEFRNQGVETIQTALGPISAIKMKRERENKSRVTTSWHAEKYGYLPIKIEQVEPDGDRYVMTLTSITIR